MLLTGAHSFLGREVLKHLLQHSDFELTAFVSPRWRSEATPKASARLKYLVADLTQPLTEEVQREIFRSDRLIHFAWVRGTDRVTVLKLNQKMVDSLLRALGQPEKFCLISSVAASSDAKSVYGQTKYEVMTQVRQKGGISLVCGLVMSQPSQGAHGMLVKFIQSLPLSVRFNQAFPVYPIALEDVCRAILKVCEAHLLSGNYRLFSTEIQLNQFLETLERQFPKRRIKITLNAAALLKCVRGLSKIGLCPPGPAEKLLTFLFKNPEELSRYAELPEMPEATSWPGINSLLKERGSL